MIELSTGDGASRVRVGIRIGVVWGVDERYVR